MKSKMPGQEEKEQEKLLKKRINDLISRSEKTGRVQYTSFLTPAEQTFLSEIEDFRGRIEFVGGYDEAERRTARISSSEYDHDEGAPFEVFHAQATDKNGEISHRDVLGALMGLGINREMIGDIMTSGNTAYFLCMKSIKDFVETNLDKIGKYRVRLKRSDLEEIPQPKTEKSTINVSSLRLDSVCAEAFGISRTKASEMIGKGSVSLNWKICTEQSEEIRDGDRIALRGKGKVRICEREGLSRKGRVFLGIERYV